MVSANPYIHKEKFCAENARYIRHLVYMAFPIYRLPWITAGSSNYLIFFLMILGNTFTLGAVKELSRGSIPCILAHMLIDTAAVTMLVGSNLTKVALLVGVEIILSVILVGILGRRQKQQSQV